MAGFTDDSAQMHHVIIRRAERIAIDVQHIIIFQFVCIVAFFILPRHRSTMQIGRKRTVTDVIPDILSGWECNGLAV